MKLRPYQEVGRDFLASRTQALLADEMRVGKTPQAILAAEKLGARDVLVVCPAIAVSHWWREWAKWGAVAGKSMLPRLQIMSYEGALAKHERGDLRGPWDVAIIDESHYAGNPTAKRTKMIFGKGGVAWRSRHTWALSGTPAPKHAGSLWPMLRCFGVVSMSYYDFIKRYCRIDWLSQRPIGTREEMIPEIRALWQRIGLRRTRKEVAPEMPDIGFEFLEIEPTRDADIDAPIDDLESWIEAHANFDREDRVKVAAAKVTPLSEEILAAIKDGAVKQTVVFGWHLKPMCTLGAILVQQGLNVRLLTGDTNQIQRVRTQEQFACGLIDVVIAQIRAAGTAIDLSAASHGYFLELDWVPANNMQAANRLIAIGKNEPVTFDICTVPGSVDDRVQRILLRRARELGKLFETEES